MIKAFKNRTIDKSKPVQVYRCLNRAGVTYSIRQGEYVVAHTDEVELKDVVFIVREAGKKRCLTSKVRNVHAFVRGKLDKVTTPNTEDWCPLRYTPFTRKNFEYKENHTWKELVSAESVHISPKAGILVKNPSNE
jgi:hypothetical protein